jgi:hypothetical protein
MPCGYKKDTQPSGYKLKIFLAMTGGPRLMPAGYHRWKGNFFLLQQFLLCQVKEIRWGEFPKQPALDVALDLGRRAANFGKVLTLGLSNCLVGT